MNKLLTILIGAFLCFGATMLMPFTGGGAGISPIPSAWAGFTCDADGDGHDRFHHKWCPSGDDIDDSDPCNPVPEEGDPTYSSCGGGGTGTGGDLGSAISMDCTLVGNWGDLEGETIKGDKLGEYKDAVDKINCSIEGPSEPWPIRLGVGVKGNGANSVRKVDINLGDLDLDFEMPDELRVALTEDQQLQLGSKDDLSDYPTLFEAAASDNDDPNMNEMDLIRLGVRPYRNPEDQQTADGIHLLTPGEIYEMGMRFSIPGTEHFNFSIASKWYEGNESFTGIGCETGFENQILANAPPVAEGGDSGMQDVSVYLWLDGDDADDLPDGYTVSTGQIIKPNSEGPPTIDSGLRYAAVCSSVGPAVCGNPHAPSNCNFLGYVPVTFTMHARVK